MKIYLVGGAVRDQMLNRPIVEKDYVVVGATIADMTKLGFKQVGKDFPVFIHPKTGEEYALARTEKKVSAGYQGFVFTTDPTVTLTEDLMRRDLTINAMAIDENGKLFDPYHGKKDIERKLLRHVSSHFIEDPVRILRVSRFLARYKYLGFIIANETKQLMQTMVQNGEVNALVAERVWKELWGALAEKNPEAFFAALAECGASAVLFPDMDLTAHMERLSFAAKMTISKKIRLAVFLYHLSIEKIISLSKRYRFPNDYAKLSLLIAKYYHKALHAKQLSAEELLTFLLQIDILRHQKRFSNFLEACKIIAQSEQLNVDDQYLIKASEIILSVPVQPFLEQGLKGVEIAKALNRERITRLGQTFLIK